MKRVKESRRPRLRERRAHETRRLIVQAARSLFLKKGYGATTIEDIAGRAGVAVSTVYAVYRSKRGILRAIREAWHQQSQIRDVVFSAPKDLDVAARLDQLARATRLQWETGSAVIVIYQGAAAADAKAAAELKEALRGRRSGLSTFARGLGSALRKDVPPERATAVIQALCLPEVHEELVIQGLWTEDEYETWLAAALKRELLP